MISVFPFSSKLSRYWLGRVWNRLSMGKEGSEFACGYGQDTLVETGLRILRLGTVLSLLVFGPSSLRVEHLPRFTLWYIAALYCLLHIATAYARWRFRDKGVRVDHVLTHLQVGIDTAFAAVVLLSARNVESAAIGFYAPALLSVSHRSVSAKNWGLLTAAITGVAGLSIGACAYSGGMVNGQPLFPVTYSVAWQLFETWAVRTCGMVAGSIVLRLYRINHLRLLAVATAARVTAQNKLAESQALRDGVQCGVSILNMQGVITYWNQKQRQEYATPEAVKRQERGSPCYWVYHSQKEPCRWCGLKWLPKKDAGSQNKPGEENDDSPNREIWEIDGSDLEGKIKAGRNWAISSQLEAGCPPHRGLHLFHMYYGTLRSPNGKIDGVVEVVADVTDTVFEMPFLLKKFESLWSPKVADRTAAGVPPIGVVSPLGGSGPFAEKQLMRMNSPKAMRARELDGTVPDPMDRVGWPCFQAYGRDRPCDQTRCPVNMASTTGIVARRLLNHPSHALVTAVPLFGPERTNPPTVRAVVEFIEDVEPIVQTMAAIREMNSSDEEADAIRISIEAMRKVTRAKSVSWWTVDQKEDTVAIWDGPVSPKDTPSKFQASEVVLYGQLQLTLQKQQDGRDEVADVMEMGTIIRSDDLRVDERIPDSLRSLARLRELKHAVFIPIATPRGQILTVAVLEQACDAPEPIHDDLVAHCCTIANATAGAILRAEAHRKVIANARRRSAFLDAITKNVDKTDIDEIIPGILRDVGVLMPGVSVAAFIMDYPWDITIAYDDPKAEDVRMYYHSGAGNPEYDARRDDKWQPGKTFCHPHRKTMEMIRMGKPLDAPCSAGSSTLCCEGTQSLYAVPFTYRGETLGCLVAESPLPKDRGLPTESQDMLSLMAGIIGLLVGRARLVADYIEGVVSDTHGLVAPQSHLAALRKRISEGNLEGIRQVALDLVERYGEMVRDLRVEAAVYMINSGHNPLSLGHCRLKELVRRASEAAQRKPPWGTAPVLAGGDYNLEYNVICDEQATVWILAELFFNAWKNSPEESSPPWVILRASPTGGTLRVTVENTYVLPAGTDPRRRGRSVFSDDEGGLGLRFARSLMSAQRGSLTKSKRENGVFAIDLVFSLADDEASH